MTLCMQNKHNSYDKEYKPKESHKEYKPDGYKVNESRVCVGMQPTACMQCRSLSKSRCCLCCSLTTTNQDTAPRRMSTTPRPPTVVIPPMVASTTSHPKVTRGEFPLDPTQQTSCRGLSDIEWLAVCCRYAPPSYGGYEGYGEPSPYDGGYWGGVNGRQVIHLQAIYPESLLNTTLVDPARRTTDPAFSCNPDTVGSTDNCVGE